MVLPASKNALKKLGDRLATGDQPTAEDSDLLNEFILSYSVPLAEVERIVTQAGYSPTPRLKTRGTLIDKLIRDPKTKLPSIQDVAGLRVTVKDRFQQNLAVGIMNKQLAAQNCPVKTLDRRATPSHGYRAVHMIIVSQSVPVELQIRTELQDLWAQVSERMGDRFGRGIRYGEAPNLTGDTEADKTIKELVDGHRVVLSEVIAELEVITLNLHAVWDELMREQHASDQLLYEIDRGRSDDHDTFALRREFHEAEAATHETSSVFAGMLEQAGTLEEALKSRLRKQIAVLQGKGETE